MQGTKGNNIIATLKGSSNKTILLGSHYDSQKDTFGYDDSGSGVTAVLRAAEILTKNSSMQIIYLFCFTSLKSGWVGQGQQSQKIF